jgi:hypothetical protein
MRARAAGDLEHSFRWSNRVFRQTLVDERSFRRIWFVSIEEVVKLGVSA